MFTSPLRKVAPAIVLASPRVASAQQARNSRKAGCVPARQYSSSRVGSGRSAVDGRARSGHGKRKAILDNVIVMIAPVYNVDGTDTYVTQDGGLGGETPHILGAGELTGPGSQSRCREADHRRRQRLVSRTQRLGPVAVPRRPPDEQVNHGYANTYGTTTVPAAAPGPRTYMTETLFPAVRNQVRRDFGLEVFTHALATPTPGRRKPGATIAPPGPWRRSSS